MLSGRKDFQVRTGGRLLHDPILRMRFEETIMPHLAAAYFTRGMAHASTGNAKQAQADQDKALELDPSLGRQ